MGVWQQYSCCNCPLFVLVVCCYCNLLIFANVLAVGTQPSMLSHALQHMQRAQQEAEATKAQQQPAEASFLAIKPAGKAFVLRPTPFQLPMLDDIICSTVGIVLVELLISSSGTKHVLLHRLLCLMRMLTVLLALLPPPTDPVHQTSWEMLRGLGAGFWLSEASQVRVARVAVGITPRKRTLMVL